MNATARIGPYEFPWREHGTPLLFHVTSIAPDILPSSLRSDARLKAGHGAGATRAFDDLAGDRKYLFLSVAREHEGTDTGIRSPRHGYPATPYGIPTLAFDLNDLRRYGRVSYRAGDLIIPYMRAIGELEHLSTDEQFDLLEAFQAEEETDWKPTLRVRQALPKIADAATLRSSVAIVRMLRHERDWLASALDDRAGVNADAANTLSGIARTVASASIPRAATKDILRTFHEPFRVSAANNYPWPFSLWKGGFGEVLFDGELPLRAARYIRWPGDENDGYGTWVETAVKSKVTRSGRRSRG